MGSEGSHDRVNSHIGGLIQCVDGDVCLGIDRVAPIHQVLQNFAWVAALEERAMVASGGSFVQ